MCTGDREDKKSGVLSLMFVRDADIEDIEPKLLKDTLQPVEHFLP
jgi:hypothetical protein